MAERYVAVDNVCAWPNLTRLPGGDIVATIFNQPTHGGWEGDVECWASGDGGRTWTRRGIPAPHEPGTNRMNVAAGCGADGELLVLASGWSRRNPAGVYSSPHEGEVLPILVCRSPDGGRTWDRTGSVAAPPEPGVRLVPFGDIVRLADDTLGVCIYTTKSTTGFYTSSDNGRTWTARAPIGTGGTNETAPLVLPTGRLLAAARTLGDQHLELFHSDDHGASWNPAGPLTLGLQHPGHLLRLRDGRLLLTYGIRNQGLYGIGARFSPDGGATWEPPRVLVDFQTATDGGYPASVETEDGTLVTAYYCNAVPAHQRYHMGVLRWQAER
ncbi:MAG: sialidase family protein [Lentisphaeria bacterium]|jgi:photosystem II stability/assembly factor-like uncharacterized protein|nr:sialidase family protein [Lentisphaeria bacterium]